MCVWAFMHDLMLMRVRPPMLKRSRSPLSDVDLRKEADKKGAKHQTLRRGGIQITRMTYFPPHLMYVTVTTSLLTRHPS